MKVLMAASEIAPFAKTGGLADVLGSLPIALKALDIDVELIMPKYKTVQTESVDLGDIRVEIEDQLVIGRYHRCYLPGTDIPVYLIEQDDYFNRDGLYSSQGTDYTDNLERFAFFCKAVMNLVENKILQPDLIHCNDWQTALIPVYIKTNYANHPTVSSIKTLFTIHNLAYQGCFPVFLYSIPGIGWEHFHLDALEFYNQINLMKGGIVFSDAVNTVSPTYAKEIQTPEFGSGLDGILRKRSDKLIGILNGVDYTEWSPDVDQYIPRQYTRNNVAECKEINKRALLEEFNLPVSSERTPLFGVVSRLAQQKGLDLLAGIIPRLVRHGVQIVVLGTGEPNLERTFQIMRNEYPKSCGVEISYDNRLAHWIEAGADFFLMPSRYEPCGLNQIYSLRYGTIPIVRAVGGLADTIFDVDEHPEGNGFVFHESTADALFDACHRAIEYYQNRDAWLTLLQRAMSYDFSWQKSALDYKATYEKIVSK